MSDNASSWAEDIIGLFSDRSFSNDIAQLRAKSLLKELSQEESRWKYNPSKLIKNITLATTGLEMLSRSNIAMLETHKLQSASLSLARAWESLAHLGERTSKSTASINSAILYELAGYQANAACLAKQIYRDIKDNDLPQLIDLASHFLRRRFVQTYRISQLLLKEPSPEKAKDSLIEDIALAHAAKGFMNASLYFLNGSAQFLSDSRDAFKVSEKVYSALSRFAEANLVNSIVSILPVMQKRSTWSYFEGTLGDHPKWERYLKLLARGTGSDILRSPSVSELWPSQLHALKNSLFDASSKIIKMQTSAGKTRIAELAIAHTLITFPQSKCVYIAPYKALVGELEQTFINLFGDLGFKVSTIIDDAYALDDFEADLIDQSDILVMTPEKLDLLHRAKPEILESVLLFILDEGHIVDQPARGIKFELLLSRLKRRLPNTRFIFLSAVVPEQTLNDFASWFNAEKNDIISTDWRPSILRVASFEWVRDKGQIKYANEEDMPTKEFVHGVIVQKTYEEVTPKGKRKEVIFPDPENKSQVAAELAWKFAELGSVLVFCSQTNFAKFVGKALLQRLGYAMKNGESIPLYFDPQMSLAIPAAKEWLGDDHPVTQLLNSGIAIHYGTLPEVVRKSVETDFRNKRFRILIATNTLAQGVNLPIRTVVVHSCWRHDEEKNEQIMIEARDYWNIVGRAGRAGEETQGLAIHIIRGERDRRDYEHYLEHRNNVEHVWSALLQLMLDLISQRISDEELLRQIDPEILAILTEEGEQFFSEENLDNILNETLVNVQAKRISNLDIRPLKKAFQIAASRIVTDVDKDFWPVYSSTGLSTNSCEKIKKFVCENESAMREFLTRSRTYEEILPQLMTFCLTLDEMQHDKEINVNYAELLSLWLKGIGIQEIVAHYRNEVKPADLAEFVEDFFSYRLPWGVSAIIQIAMRILAIEKKDLTDIATFFPSMIKYGVPTPESSWAISAGIPFRNVAIKISERYESKKQDREYDGFLEYVTKLRQEDLNNDFHLTSPFLEEVTKALSKSSTNTYLRNFDKHLLPIETWVNGIRFGGTAVARAANENDRVELVREYDNDADRNAILVLLNGKKLGYVEKSLAQRLAPDIDAGQKIEGTIVEIERRDIPNVKLRLE